MKKRYTSSLSTKIVLSIAVASVCILLIIFTAYGNTNKKAFYKVETEKAHLIATTIEPLLAINIFLQMDFKIEQIARQLLENPYILAVRVFQKGTLIHETTAAGYQADSKEAFSITQDIHEPNSKEVIGVLELVYSSKRYNALIDEYTELNMLLLLGLCLFFLLFSLYVKKLLFPLRNIANTLKNCTPECTINIPYTAERNEIGLISSSLNELQQRISEYSKQQQDINQLLEEQVRQRTEELQKAYDELNLYKNHLEERVQEEVAKNREQTTQMLNQSRLAQMGEMISMIAHQWRQPLAAISSISGTLSMDVIMDEYKKEFFEERLNAIADLTQHLSSTIDDFRGFFKDTKEKKESTLEALKNDSLQIIEPTLVSHGILLHNDCKESDSIVTYPNELKQVILNIIKNAEDNLLEKKVDNPHIWFRTYHKEGMACLSIEDNGGGIPEAIMDKIFDPYFSTKKQKDGTGLGLYMSKTIIEEHCQGKLNAQNTPQGVCFEIALPLQLEETENDAEQTGESD